MQPSHVEISFATQSYLGYASRSPYRALPGPKASSRPGRASNASCLGFRVQGIPGVSQPLGMSFLLVLKGLSHTEPYRGRRARHPNSRLFAPHAAHSCTSGSFEQADPRSDVHGSLGHAQDLISNYAFVQTPLTHACMHVGMRLYRSNCTDHHDFATAPFNPMPRVCWRIRLEREGLLPSRN